ncbi:hypothetical protein BGX28_006473 [Mortierella sp. GBA30]|nr:hypothetical protein BGX28_006473 [Mortierella sp. GBA30]
MDISGPDNKASLPAVFSPSVLLTPTHPTICPSSPNEHRISSPSHQLQHLQHPHQYPSRLTLMSLPDECLSMLISWVANQGVQDLYPLLCVNKRFFYHVVPILYRDPFRLSARWVWRRSIYKGVIERQTKLIRTLLLCCTRTIAKVTPSDADGSILAINEVSGNHVCNTNNSNNSINSSNNNKYWSGTYVAKAIAAAKDRRRGDRGVGMAARIVPAQSSSCQPQSQQQHHQQQQQQRKRDHASASVRENTQRGSATAVSLPLSSASLGRSIPGPSLPDRGNLNVSLVNSMKGNNNSDEILEAVDEETSRTALHNARRSRLQSFFHKCNNYNAVPKVMHSPPTKSKGKGYGQSQSIQVQEHPPQRHLWRHSPFRQQQQMPMTVERIPIVWDADNNQPETRCIPGLEKSKSSNTWCFPAELTKTILRLADEPTPMINYLSYVTHTDVRSWSAASNMALVHQILGNARLSWHARLQILLLQTSRRIRGQEPSSSARSDGGRGGNSGSGNANFMSRHAHDDLDNDVDNIDDDIMEANFIRRRGRYRRWRRDKRNKNLWGTADVKFVELLFLFYTSERTESLSLGMNCSHWYHPSLDVLTHGIPERLSGLRRIVIDHADTIIPNAIPVPQLFIERHQKAFPGQLREIQVRQSYHYSYDMSKSVLETIQMMDRLEVLDLSIWTGVFSGLDSIRTDHLRKLLVCHHMDVPKPDVFDGLLKRCLVLEELSIIVPHPHLFTWAVERRQQAAGPSSSSSSTLTPLRRRLPPQHLPPLRILTLFGHTPDVAGTFKDVMYAFQDTLESVQVSMYPDLTKSGESNFEVPVPDFAVAPDADENAPQPSASSSALFGLGILQDPLQSASATPDSSSQNDPTAAIATVAPPSHQDIEPEAETGTHNDSHQSSSSSPSGSTGRTSSTVPSSLTWDWPLPRLRTMSLRGPLVTDFDLGLVRFCPQLTDLALSYHCSRLPRLAYPGPSSTTSDSTGVVNNDVTPGPNRTFPRIMVCESLAFKWGMPLQEERRSLVVI